MRCYFVIATISLLFSGCNDSGDSIIGFSKPELRSEIKLEASAANIDLKPREKTAFSFPAERLLTDKQGRQISVNLLAKRGNEIAFLRVPSNRKFVLSLDKLSLGDQDFFLSLADGGDQASFSAVSPTVVTLGERTAIWHSQINNAEKEASQLGIPMLITVLISGDRESDELEKTLVYSREFKYWADRNVVLCLIRADGEKGGGSRDTAYQTWQTLADYGIKQSSDPAIALISHAGSRGHVLEVSSFSAPEKAVAMLDEVVRKENSWASIKVVPPPERAASPFRVNGGAVFTGSGSSGTSCGSA